MAVRVQEANGMESKSRANMDLSVNVLLNKSSGQKLKRLKGSFLH